MRQTGRIRVALGMLALAVAVLVSAWQPELPPARAQTVVTATPTWTPLVIIVNPGPTSTPIFFPTPTPFGFVPPPLITASPTIDPFAPIIPTATATPDTRVIAEIIAPAFNSVVVGFVPIVGTALIDNFINYDVHIAPTGSENWQWLTTSGAVVRNGVLFNWNTFLVPDGFYDIRVRAIRVDGNYSETFVRQVEVRNGNPPTPTPVINALGTRLPSAPVSPLFPVGPTATPSFRTFVPGGQGMFVPRSGDVLKGLVTVVGTVNGKTFRNPFVRYELAVTPAGENNYGWIYAGEEQIWQNRIYVWDTTRLADGFYDLRLRIVYQDGNYDEYYATSLRIANAPPLPGVPGATGSGLPSLKTPGLYFPRTDQEVTGEVGFIGTTSVPDFLRWELYWSPAGAEAWRFLFSDSSELTNSLLARFNFNELPGGTYDFRLRIVQRNYDFSDYYVRGLHSLPPTPTVIPGASPLQTP